MTQAPHTPSTAQARRRRFTRVAFHLHLWLGVIFTAVLLVISATGVALNHKRALGLMPDVAHTPTAAREHALPLAQLAAIGLQAGSATAEGKPETLAYVNRMDVRPNDGYVKVRLRDAAAVVLVIILGTGFWLWMAPRISSRRGGGASQATPTGGES